MLGNIACAKQPSEVVKATLNGLEFVFDAETGSILSMFYPGPGSMLQTAPDNASIVDLAYPVKEFEPLRLASRFSRNAQITMTSGKVVIHWDELGASRSFCRFQGRVSATVILKEDADGKSVIMSCKIDNQSDHSVRQVIFPDFLGIVPFAGIENTEFRTGGFTKKPFVNLVVGERDAFYARHTNTQWYRYGTVFNNYNPIIRWMNIGSVNGGFSIFQKLWGANQVGAGVFLQLSEITGKLRYMRTLHIDIAPKTTWQSAEFVLTPHQNGWAEGIAPYRLWVKQHIKPLYPLPAHVRDGLGFRSIWMRNCYSSDPEGINFKFADLPKVARECKEHGLDELVLWGWAEKFFTLPLPAPNCYLGTEQDMANAVAECKKIGVNVAPIISVVIAGPETAHKYGLKPGSTNYTYHPEFIPMMRPPYASANKGTMVPASNPLWQEEVLASCKHLIDIGVPSIFWDQFFTGGPEPNLDTLTVQIRKLAKDKDPQSTFSGEAGKNLEVECNYIDYTWNWFHGCDYRPLVSSLPAPRINVNIDKSVARTKYCFADNLYVNVWPRKPGGINGSDYISNHPQLSAALKQCARLRKQFLNYFIEGTFIADCILSKVCPAAHISAYVQPDSVLVIVINKENKRKITFECDIQPWLKSPTGRYKIKHYNDGNLIKTTKTGKCQWRQTTPQMKKLDIILYELFPN